MSLKLSRGAKSSSSYIATNLSSTSVEDLSRDVYDNLNAIHTALESVRENQTNIPEKAYYIGTKEEKPPFVDYAEGLPAEGWSSTLTEPPEGKVVWMSERMTSSTGTTKTLWSEPIVITGEKGEVGAGSYTIISETASQTFPENATDLFIEEVGRKPVKGDNLTFTNANRTQATSREFNGTSWEPTKTAIDGSWLIKGSVTTDSIAANIGITAPNISGGTLQGTTITNGNNFNVDASGNVTAKDANISGTINATSGSFTGTIAAQSGYLNDVTINESCKVLGKFSVNQIEGAIASIKVVSVRKYESHGDTWRKALEVSWKPSVIGRTLVIPAIHFNHGLRIVVNGSVTHEYIPEGTSIVPYGMQAYVGDSAGKVELYVKGAYQQTGILYGQEMTCMLLPSTSDFN